MKQSRLGRFLGLTRNELEMLLFLGGMLVCVALAFGGYVIYNTGQAAPGGLPSPSRKPSRTLIPTGTHPSYYPAPSLANWVSGTPATDTPTIRPTRTRAPTSTPRPTSTPTSTWTPMPPTPVPPTATVQLGTAGNPAPIGSALTLPDLGALTVTRSSWLPGQTGLAILELSFVCERPPGSECHTDRLILDAIGSSGTGYQRAFDTAIPQPRFGYGLGAPLYAGGVETGSTGFTIKGNERSIVMRVQIFLQEGQFFFWIGPASISS